jgi:hypothetical protein
LLLRRLLLLQQLRCRLPWRGLPLWHPSLFRWWWLHQLRLFQLRLQQRQRPWPLPRLQAQFHQPLWQPLVLLLQQRSPLWLWQRHPWQQIALRLACLRRQSIALVLPGCSMQQQRCPKLF